MDKALKVKGILLRKKVEMKILLEERKKNEVPHVAGNAFVRSSRGSSAAHACRQQQRQTTQHQQLHLTLHRAVCTGLGLYNMATPRQHVARTLDER